MTTEELIQKIGMENAQLVAHWLTDSAFKESEKENDSSEYVTVCRYRCLQDYSTHLERAIKGAEQ